MLFTFALPTFASNVDVSNGDWKITNNFCYFNDNFNKFVSVQTSSCLSNDFSTLVNSYGISNISSLCSTNKYKINTLFSKVSKSAILTKDNDIRIELKNNFLIAYVDNDPNKAPKKFIPSRCTYDVSVTDINGKVYNIDDVDVSLKLTNSSNNQYSIIIDLPFQNFDIYQVTVGIIFDFDCFNGSGDIYSFMYGCSQGEILVDIEQGDKTTGLLDSIIEWIKQIVEDIKSLGQSIANLPELIKEKLSSLFENIANKLTELGNNIIEGLKSLFIPEEGFFDDKKAEMEAFLEDHFGIIYTAPNIAFTIFEKLLSISPGEPCLTFPAIEFEFLGEYIKLSDPITINLYDFVAKGTPLYTIYQFYRAGMTAFLIFLFVEYAMNKYNYLFGKDGEAVN